MQSSVSDFEPSPSGRPTTPRKTVDKAAQVITAGEAYDRHAIDRLRKIGAKLPTIARPIGDKELAALLARRGIHQPPGVRRAKLRAVMCCTLVGLMIERQVIVVPRAIWIDCSESATIGKHETAIYAQKHFECFVLADKITADGEVIQ